jgi:hypothetical protein
MSPSGQPNRPVKTALVPGHGGCGAKTDLRDPHLGCAFVLILAGDHLYRMNYAEMAASIGAIMRI